MKLVEHIAKLLKGPMPLPIRRGVVELGDQLVALEAPCLAKFESLPPMKQRLQSIVAGLNELKQDLESRRQWPSTKARAPQNHRERRIWELDRDILLTYSELDIVVARWNYEVRLIERLQERFDFAIEHFHLVHATWESAGERRDRTEQTEQALGELREDLRWLARDQEWLNAPNPVEAQCAQVDAKLVEIKNRTLAISEARPEPECID